MATVSYDGTEVYVPLDEIERIPPEEWMHAEVTYTWSDTSVSIPSTSISSTPSRHRIHGVDLDTDVCVNKDNAAMCGVGATDEFAWLVPRIVEAHGADLEEELIKYLGEGIGKACDRLLLFGAIVCP